MVKLNATEAIRLQRGCEHLSCLGSRATAELLTDVASRIGGMPAILTVLEEYKRISPGQVRQAGGDRFPARRLMPVPR